MRRSLSDFLASGQERPSERIARGRAPTSEQGPPEARTRHMGAGRSACEPRDRNDVGTLGSHSRPPVCAETPGTSVVGAASQAGRRVGGGRRRWRTKRWLERWEARANVFGFRLTEIAIAEPALRAWLAELASQWNQALGRGNHGFPSGTSGLAG